MKSYIHTIKPQIANIIGEPESVLLNQLEYWISKCGKNIENFNGKWIYNSYKQWSKQFSYWSISKLRRKIKSLEDLGLIRSTKADAKKWNQTKYYSINYSKYNKLLRDNNLDKNSFHSNNTKKNISVNHNLCLDKKNNNKNIVKKTDLLKNKNCHNIYNNVLKKPGKCICSKWTTRVTHNEQMFNKTKNNNKYNNKKEIVENKKIENSCNFVTKKNSFKILLNKWRQSFKKKFIRTVKLWKEKLVIKNREKGVYSLINDEVKEKEKQRERNVNEKESFILMKINDREEKKDFNNYLLKESKRDKYCIHKRLGEEYNIGIYANSDRFMHGIHSILTINYQHIYNVFLRIYIIKKYYSRSKGI